MKKESYNIILIGAIGKNKELGKDNKLIWYIPDDLKFFKENTLNHTIVMGYNTFISLPKLLEKRHHIVLTRKTDLNLPKEVTVFHDKQSVLEYANKTNEDIYIIGGASIYKEFINDSNKMILTEIDDTCPTADVYFPDFNKSDWDTEIITEKEYEKLSYRHVLYKRKK